MKAAFFWLAVLAASVGAFFHYGNQVPLLKELPLFQQSRMNLPEPASAPPLLPDSGGAVSVISPLAELMKGAQMEKSEDDPAPRHPQPLAPSDHVGSAPTGTVTILHRSFPLTTGVNYSFVIPPQAATPKLTGTFQSSPANSNQPADENADIAFLLMNQEQYDTLLQGHIGDAIISVDSTHYQDVNVALPPTYNQPKKFYLVFRNLPHEAKRKVQANFRVDF